MMGFYLFSICVNALSLLSSVFVIYALSLLAVFLGFGFMGVDSIGLKLVGVDLFRALVYTFCALPWFAIIFRFIKRKWFSSRIRPLYQIFLILFLIHFVQPISAMDIGMESEAFALTGSAVVSSLAVHTFPERFQLQLTQFFLVVQRITTTKKMKKMRARCPILMVTCVRLVRSHPNPTMIALMDPPA